MARVASSEFEGFCCQSTSHAQLSKKAEGRLEIPGFVGGVPATPELAAALRQSVVASIKAVTGAGSGERPLTDLLTTEQMVLTPEVAELLGLDAVGPGLQTYDSTGRCTRCNLSRPKRRCFQISTRTASTPMNRATT